jgi:hypothetical protein
MKTMRKSKHLYHYILFIRLHNENIPENNNNNNIEDIDDELKRAIELSKQNK